MPLTLSGSNGVAGVDGSAGTPALQGSDSNTGIAFGADTIIGSTGGSERFRCDSSGRWLLGTSTSYANYGTPLLQLDNSSGAELSLRRSVTTDATNLGYITAYSTHGLCSSIQPRTDGTQTSTSTPGAIAFLTQASGSTGSPTERVRINNKGAFMAAIGSADYATTDDHHQFFSNQNNYGVRIYMSNTSRTAENLRLNAVQSASSGWFFSRWYSGDGSSGSADLEFQFTGNGNGSCDGSFTGGGADYAEYFEWSDSNPDEEDRRGISVVLDGDKIREAVAGEDPIGVISGNPSVVGDAAWNKWSGKYLRDEFGTYIQEDYEVINDKGEPVVQQRRKLNPAYDPDQEYIPREQRPEWDCVGLMGKLRIRKGQITGSRWIKMRDISDSVEEWLVR